MMIDANAVFDILVEECAADPEDRQSFTVQWPDSVEWRFMGNQGFGGKVWNNAGRVYVTCYPENDNRDRQASRERANDRLAALARGDKS